MPVHVMAANGPEQHCTSAHPYDGADDGDEVLTVYHGHAEQHGDEWGCPVCGEDTTGNIKMAADPETPFPAGPGHAVLDVPLPASKGSLKPI